MRAGRCCDSPGPGRTFGGGPTVADGRPRPDVAERSRERVSTTKSCPDCGVDVEHRSGPIPRCERCGKVRRRERDRAWAASKGRAYWSALQRRHYYGLTDCDFEILLEGQSRRCAICGTTDPGGRGWCVDHDHRCCASTPTCGQCVRGLLCNSCNTALGMLGDDPVTIHRALQYVVNRMSALMKDELGITYGVAPIERAPTKG